MSLAKSFFTVSFFTLLSRLLGFARDILMAAILGAGAMAEVFLVAFKLPNFFRRLFAEGAFNAAFIPIFSHKIHHEDKETAIKYSNNIMSILFFTLIIVVSCFEIAMPIVIHIIAPGFSNEQDKFALAVELSRITFPYLFFISFVALFSGMLNSIGKFAVASFSPIILNLCLISSLLLFNDSEESTAYYLSYAIALSGLLQMLWVFASAKYSGLNPKIVKPYKDKNTKEFFSRFFPGVIGAGVVQINVIIDVIIATFIPGAIAFLYYADRINQLPLALIGTAMGTVLLPSLSKEIKAHKNEKAIKTQNRALECILFFALPSTAALIILALPIISVLFERGNFTHESAIATSYSLIFYAIGLPAFMLAKICSTSFFAFGDTKTPVKIAIIALITNFILNITFINLFPLMGLMPHAGLAFATSIASWLNVIILSGILFKKEHFHFDSQLKSSFKKIVIMTFFMSMVLIFSKTQISDEMLYESPMRYLYLIFLVSTGIITYFAIGYKFRIYNLKNIIGKNNN